MQKIEIDRPEISINTLDDGKNILTPVLVDFLQTADPHSYLTIKEELLSLPNYTTDLSEMLNKIRDDDEELIKRVLGYSKWFYPIEKTELRTLLVSRGFKVSNINNICKRLEIEELLKNTKNYILPNEKTEKLNKIFEQSMASIMSEILEIVELN